MRIELLLILALIHPAAADAQPKARLNPGKLYEAGDTIYAPRYGFTSTVPAGWQGTLPRESEVFLLSAIGQPYGEIFVFARESSNLSTISQTWQQGVELDKGINLKAKGPPVEKEGILSAEGILQGTQVKPTNRHYAVARCSPHGPCVIALMTAPSQGYEQARTVAEGFMRRASFEPPSTASPYANLDWKKFLGGKMVVSFAMAESGTREGYVHLCPDGSFKANVKKTGYMKGFNPEYKGNMKGTWSADGIGDQGTLMLSFKKDPPVRIELLIQEEKVYLAGERCFVAQSDQCK
jgi:hypothetical protein